MATLDAIRIKNLRSLEDTGWVEQRPITVLVGKNSAGKSTFARAFPLLRQSATSKRRSPLLWFGQFVDFGQFSTAVHNHDLSKGVEFQFKLTLSADEVDDEFFPFRSSVPIRNRSISRRFEIAIGIKLRSGDAGETADTIAEALTLKSQGITAKFHFNELGSVNSVSVEGIEVWKLGAGELSHVTYESALPTLTFLREKKHDSDEVEDGDGTYFEGFDPFRNQLIREVRKYVHGNLGEDKIHQLASRLEFGGDDYFLQQTLIAGMDSKTWTDHFKRGSSSPRILMPLKKAVFTAKLLQLIAAIDRHLTVQFGAVKYIEPLRATAQRYYRQQDLAIDELDPKGGNVAQFLQSLPNWRKSNFDALSLKLFGFKVQPKIQAGHIELLLEQEGDKRLVNLADAGVGFSQMLPILLQVWSATDNGLLRQARIQRGQDSYLVVEQPELHLHPAYQAALADLFCEVSRGDSARRRGRMIIETHSPALVNRLGALVADGRLDADDVQILIFEPDSTHRSTTLRKATFDPSGELTNWPFGFFEPEV